MSHTTQLPMPQCRPAENGSAARRYLALAIIASGMFMGVLDTTIVNVALPAIRASFGAQVSALAWIVDAYTLSFAALIMMGGTASDRLDAPVWAFTELMVEGIPDASQELPRAFPTKFGTSSSSSVSNKFQW